jgi:hypothetical protein
VADPAAGREAVSEEAFYLAGLRHFAVLSVRGHNFAVEPYFE